MTTQTIFKPHIGVATEKKDQPGWTTDGPSAITLVKKREIALLVARCEPIVCAISR